MSSSIAQAVRVPVRRYLFWIRYDGSQFPEMARGGTGFGVMDLLQQTTRDVLYGQRPVCSPQADLLKFSPSSRTDAHVHALRNAIICQVPLEQATIDDTLDLRQRTVVSLNNRIRQVHGSGLTVLDVQKVSAGFCIRRSVEYRKYTYRLAIVRDWDLWSNVNADPSTACFSEQNYSWRLPPGFCPSRAEEACKLFEGVHTMGSFYKHTAREKRLEPRSASTIRNLLHVGVTKGEAYSLPNEIYDYFNVTVVARSFVREQIRRMMSCIVLHSYGRLPIRDIKWLLNNPISSNFYDRRIPIAPPNGLFLTDVVYDPKNYVNPSPYYYHSWDYEMQSN